ncbi:amidase [Ottowia sp.]|uniref:amidase n=1 Tax=Ottowia sp. TaxID=1898956 RepID=UPI0039E36950
MMQSVAMLSAQLRRGALTATALAQEAIARALDTDGEGPRAFIHVDAEAALTMAAAADTRLSAGTPRSPIDGLPVSVKDLFDVAGQVTRAGSLVLAGASPATAHAAVVRRLVDAGAVIIGRTNMTEFAYSGLGINPHYGTPLNPWDRAQGRIPGGSSSGAAVSVSDGMAVAGIGSDTGGSVRIPAALCGLTGWKPTARRVPMRGMFPLSVHLDSIGPIARTVQCCAVLDAVLSGQPPADVSTMSLRGLRLAAPQTLVHEGVDAQVGQALERALGLLSAAGARIVPLVVPEFLELSSINARGGFTALEAWAAHGSRLQAARDRYDPRVAVRIEKGRDATLADLLALIAARQDWIERTSARLNSFDAFLMPTVPRVAPLLAPLVESDTLFSEANLLMLRNPTLINFLDGCAISLPCHIQDEAPVGLMLAAPNGSDARLLTIAQAVESTLIAWTGIGVQA